MSIKHLIVDSSPLLTGSLNDLRGMADAYYVTPDVVNELRDTRGRQVLEESKLVLTSTVSANGEAKSVPGLVVRTPSIEAVAKIRHFARLTGDIGALSEADIRVLALCLTLEIEENGTWRIRDFPGQERKARPNVTADNSEGKDASSGADTKEAAAGEVPQQEQQEVAETKSGDEGRTAAETPAEKIEKVDTPTIAETSTAETITAKASGSSSLPAIESLTLSPTESTDPVAPKSKKTSNDETDEWITPENIDKFKAKDLGLFTPPSGLDVAKKSKSVMKSAMITGDFAMQNVGMQIGLNVLGSGGKRITKLKSYVMRCHACFSISKDVERKFCDLCGGDTLIKTSVTYVAPTKENPKGIILHLKQNFQYKNRGKVYSMPTPKPGTAAGRQKGVIITREDQKEYQRGLKSANIMKEKEKKVLLKRERDEANRLNTTGVADTTSVDHLSGSNTWLDPDWLPPMLLGEKGRKAGHHNNGVRMGANGMPIVGYGRSNPNANNRKTRK